MSSKERDDGNDDLFGTSWDDKCLKVSKKTKKLLKDHFKTVVSHEKLIKDLLKKTEFMSTEAFAALKGLYLVLKVKEEEEELTEKELTEKEEKEDQQKKEKLNSSLVAQSRKSGLRLMGKA